MKAKVKTRINLIKHANKKSEAIRICKVGEIIGYTSKKEGWLWQKRKNADYCIKEYTEKISSLEDRIKEDNKMIERLKLKREDFKLRLNVEDHSFDTVYLNLHREREAIDKLQDEISTLESEFEALQAQNYQYKQIIYSKTHTNKQ